MRCRETGLGAKSNVRRVMQSHVIRHQHSCLIDRRWPPGHGRDPGAATRNHSCLARHEVLRKLVDKLFADAQVIEVLQATEQGTDAQADGDSRRATESSDQGDDARPERALVDALLERHLPALRTRLPS